VRAFNEGAGTGTINGARWIANGRFGAALKFYGVSDTVHIPSSASLNLSAAMTLAAWVRPATVVSALCDVIH
jgi:hypothetical protein